MDAEPCPCASNQPYSECCGPILTGTRMPQTAEALMRARYTAYTRGDVAYLRQSLHPKSHDTFDEKSTREWAAKSEWHGLEVLRTERGGPDDNDGVVEFIARYRNEGQDLEHREVAQFQRSDNDWSFVDGRVFGLDPIVRDDPKIGRNDPCSCGSGKKFKKCCG